MNHLISASFGIVQSCPETRIQSLLKLADDALYGAKLGGRNRVASSPLPAACQRSFRGEV
ncbi:MAG: hypothetical protein IV085_03775 [Thiobacillus sp.]|nr:hypothetical protein [Thiobacillus sp.]